MVELSKQQRLIVEDESRIVKVRACPGAGKTLVLIEKVLALVRRGWDPERILTVSFTRKAAGEIANRLKMAGVSGVMSKTLHSFCYSILKKNEFNFNIMNETQKRQLLEKGTARFEIESDRVESVVSWFNGQIDPIDWQHYYGQKRDLKIYHWYTKEKKRRNLFDFDDLIRKAWKVIAEGGIPGPKLDAILVDETQDLSPIQIRFLATLVMRSRSYLFVVGDPDQAIYGFRGAQPNAMEVLVKTASKMTNWPITSFTLNENFRSGKVITQLASRLATTAYKPSADCAEGCISWKERDNFEDCTEWLVEKVGNAADEETAVLCRTNKEAENIVKKLKNAGIVVRGREVRVITVHQAKGKEYSRILIPHLNEGVFPIKRQNVNFNEEMRILFVALTRAKDELHLSWRMQEESRYLTKMRMPPRKRIFLFFSTRQKVGSIGRQTEMAHVLRKNG